MDLEVWEKIFPFIVVTGPILAFLALASGGRWTALFLFLFWPLTVLVLLARWLYARMNRPLESDEGDPS